MNTQNDNNAADNAADKAARKRHPARRWIIATAFIAAIGTMATAGAGLMGGGGHGPMGHHRGHGQMTPEKMEKHVDKMVSHLLADGTPEQKTKLKAIAMAACTDLLPARQQFQEAHARAREILMAPVVDRAALEQLRVAQMQHMDGISKRIVAALGDAAEVLTPEQRVKFGEFMKKRGH
ncbi:MAG: periplasmic heavy metal sensor [Pseudomonadota bacterium]